MFVNENHWIVDHRAVDESMSLRDIASNMVTGARHNSFFYFTDGEVCHLTEFLTDLSRKDRIHYNLMLRGAAQVWQR